MSKEIDKRSLQLSPYEYFQYCNKTRRIRGAAVITDKQCIFYSQLLSNDYGTHNDIDINLENAIHPNNPKEGWDGYYSNHAYIASVGKELIISMPENGELSLAQAKFLSDILDQTNQFNKEQENEKVKIDFFDTPEHESIFDTKDIELIKQKLKERVTENITIEEEQIIGTTLTKEEIKQNLTTYLGLEKCSNLKEIKTKLNKSYKYEKDSYYKEIFNELFPDYQEAYELINILPNNILETEKTSNVNFNNVKEYTITSIRNIFKYNNSYFDIYSSLFNYNSNFSRLKEETKEKIFPNFKLIEEIFLSIYPKNETEETYINNQLKNITNYEEFKKVICNIAYNKKTIKLEESEKLLKEAIESLEKITVEKNIVAAKDTLNQMIESKNKKEKNLGNRQSELIENKYLIQQETEIQNKKTKSIQTNSKTFLKRLLNRKKIKEDTNELNDSKLRTEQLEAKRENQLKEIEKLEKEINQIKKEFKEITQLDFVPFDPSFMEIYYTKDISKYEKFIIDDIEKLKQKINKLKQELTKLKKTNLINQDNLELENIEEYRETNPNKHHR